MGSCFSARTKVLQSPLHNGVDSKCVSKDGNRKITSSYKVSSVLAPQKEGEILVSFNLKSFYLSELKTATRDFSPNGRLGEGGFGSVFKGWIDDHTYTAAKPGTGLVVAVKNLNHGGFQGHREWLSYNAKLSDFGLAKDCPTGDRSHVSTRIMGTEGYAAPEYITTGHLTVACDVYSFGVVLLEILSGKQVIDMNRPPEEQNLVQWAKPYLNSKRKICQLMDTRIEGQYSLGEALKAVKLTVQCLQMKDKFRPSMDEVVRALEELQHPQ